MIAEEALAIAKSYTKKSLEGVGALKGAPCTIKSITEVDGGQKVTFEWTGTSGTKQTSTMIVKNGVSVTGISDKGNGKFTLLLSDGSESDTIQCVKGEDGFSPTATVEKVGKVATITITDKNGTTTATIKDGEGSEGGEANAIDSISVNGVNVVPDENKNVDITVPSIEGLTKDADLATVAKSGNYEDLSNKPAIPSVEGLAKTTDIPTKVSELTDSADYAKTADVNDSISALQTGKADASDLTAHTNDTDIHVTAENKATWNTVSDKVDKEDGKGLSANDYTNEEKALVGTIEDKINKTSIATALDDTVTDEQVASALLAKTELDKKIDKTSIATTISSESTNDEVVGAKLAYDELQKVSSETKEQFATASGESITVNDSVDGKIRDLKLYGKSEQKKYSGKNLLNATRETFTIDGVTFKSNSDGTYTVTGTSTQKGEYEFGRIELSAGNYKLLGFQGTGIINEFCLYTYTGTMYPNDIGEGVNFTLSDTRTIYVRLAIPNGTTINMLLKPMIVDTSLYPDTTYDDYEPYVGGTPSPNPNYPQEIKSVVNPAVRVVGKNLLNPTLDTTTKNGVTCTKNDDGTYTLNGTASANTFININTNISVEIGNTYNLIGFNGDINIGKEHSIQYAVRDKNEPENIFTYSDGVFVPNVSNIISYVFIMKGITLNNVLFKPMLTTDLSATYDDFVPYQGEQTATLPYTLNAIPVKSGGNVTINGQEYIADYVDIENKKLVRRVKKKDLGEFDWNYVYNVNPKLKYFDTTILDSFKPTASHPIGEGFCDSYSVEKNNIPQSDLANNKVAIGWLNLSSTRCCLEIRDDNYTNALDFKNAVKGRYIYYPLATPTTIDLTDEEAQAFKELATYYPTTNVFVTSEQLNGYADVKYPTTDVSGIVSEHIADVTELKKSTIENSNNIKNQFNTASGDYITVTDSVDGNIVELGIKGNSFQQTYSGKNLFDCATMFPTSGQVNGITLTNNGDGTFTLSGTATANAQIFKDFTHEQTVAFFKNGAGIYTLSTQELPTTGNVFQCTLVKYNGTDSDYTWRSSPQGKAKSYNITQKMLDNELFFISFMFYIHSGNTINQTFTPQVEFGSSATDYEPYVGGIPSPNPSYPQTINSVGDDGSLVIKSENKNILNIPDGSKDSNGITTTALNGRITCSGTSTAKFADVIHNISILFQSNNIYTFSIGKPIDCDISIKLHDSNGTALSDKRILKGSTSITFTAPENVARATFYIAGFESGTAISISNLCIQVEKGDIATLPVPHKETVSTIPLSEPLRSIGDIKDEITYQNGKWGILRRIKEINLTDLAWELVNNGTYQYWRYSVNDGKEASSYNTIANIIAEKYMASSWYNTVQLNSATNAIAYGFNANNTSSKLIAVHNGSTTESPTGKFLYELVTPTFEPFADQTLQYLSTYDGVTNISNDDALSAEMTVKYPTTDASGIGSRNESRIVDIEGTVGSTDISDIGDGTVTGAISMMSSKLGGLTFSASGTTLSITDGTHTWTLEANS